ncbi:MAG: hypothetical protein J5U16_01595 [Candidatus Methanoperedens sp.]|nr:hypothetical protein [Candidatus Methanoperedens sp.]
MLRDRYDFVRIKKPARLEAIWMTSRELNEMVEVKTGFVMDALLEGKFLIDDGTLMTAKKKLETSLKMLHAIRLSHGWFIPRDSLEEVISFDCH